MVPQQFNDIPMKNLRDDALGRDALLSALEGHIVALAQVSLDRLPSPRVIAVDAPWGSGKSWVASRLAERLGRDDGHKVAFVDAFRYDHHDDVFAVIASAILEALKPDAAAKLKFVQAATAVFKASAPVMKAVVKGGADLALGVIGLDTDQLADQYVAVKDAVLDGALGASEKAMVRMLDGYASTQRVQDGFIETLSSLTASLKKPLVVIIDELDRCRPSFALEVLERIKHLFSAENVVFLLFWNGRSIRESVRHTYGQGTNAEVYLSKFTAYTVPVPMPVPRRRHAQRTRLYEFIEAELQAAFGNGMGHHQEFGEALSEFAEAFDANIREVWKALDLLRVLSGSNLSATDVAYVALLKATDEQGFLRILSNDRSFFTEEVDRLAPVAKANKGGHAEKMWISITYLSDPDTYDTAFTNRAALPPTGMKAVVLQEVFNNGRPERQRMLFDAAQALYGSLNGDPKPARRF